jgi:hypothetical protein
MFPAYGADQNYQYSYRQYEFWVADQRSVVLLPVKRTWPEHKKSRHRPSITASPSSIIAIVTLDLG